MVPVGQEFRVDELDDSGVSYSVTAKIMRHLRAEAGASTSQMVHCSVSKLFYCNLST